MPKKLNEQRRCMAKMIKVQDLVKTKFSDKHCIGFQYTINDHGVNYTFEFEKHNEFGNYNSKDTDNIWKMYARIPDICSEGNLKMVQFVFGVPKIDLSLVKIAAIGLQLFRGLMQREINLCTTIDFLINDQLEGMR